MVIIKDMKKAIKFYTEILGLKLVNQNDNQYAVLKTEGLTIGLNPVQREFEAGNCKSMSIGFLVDNLDNTINELKAKGITFSEIIKEVGIRIAYFTELDGNPLYLIEEI